MKAIYLLVAVCVIVGRASAADPLTERLQRGLFEEEANHNLDAAIKEYQSLVAQADEQRKVIATALFRLGECYRKLGRTNDADAQYRRILNDFSEQDTLVRLSRQLLPPATSTAGADDTRAIESRLARMRVEVAEQRALYNTLNALTPEQRLAAIPRLLNDSSLAELQTQENSSEQRLTSLRTTFGDEHPEIKATRAVLQAIRKQIEDKVAGLLIGLKLNADATAANIKALETDLEKMKRGIAATAPDRVSANAVPTNPADAEMARELSQRYAQSVAQLAELNSRIEAVGKLSYSDLLLTAPALFKDDVLSDLGKQQRASRERLREFASPGKEDSAKAEKENVLHIGEQIDQRLVELKRKEIQEAKLLEANVQSLKDMLAKLPRDDASSASRAPAAEAMTQAEAEELARVRTLARNSPDLLQTPNKGLTELQLAARNGHYSVAEFLLSQGVSAGEPEGNPPLITAAQLGHLRMVRLLLDKGADVDSKDPRSGSALMQAVAFGFKSVAELLVERGADVNRPGGDGMTPLHLAARSGHASIAELLLRHGARPNALSTSSTSPDGQNGSVSANGATPLQLAAGHGFTAMAELLLKSGASVKATNYDRMTPLHFAAYGGHTNLCAMLLEKGADLNAQDATGMTPLTRAIERRKLEAVELLVRHGADVNLPITAPVYARYPINLAVQSGWTEIVKAVLANKPDLQATNRDGQRPLYQAIRQNNGDIVEALLKAGADANQASPRWGLPLIEAAFNGRVRIVESLLNHGGNPNVQTADGETPLSRALHITSQPIGNGVANLGTVVTGELKAAYREIADLLQQHHADEFLQRRGFISAVRGTEQRVNIFSKGTNDVNRYTLFEFLAAVYQTGGTDFPFPDLAKITIHRVNPTVFQLKSDSETKAGPNAVAYVTTKQPILVNALKLLEKTNDCGSDVPLEWGDEVEIPMADHSVNEVWRGLLTRTPDPKRAIFIRCTDRTVLFSIAGNTERIPLSVTLVDPSYANVSRTPEFRLSATVLRDNRFRNLLRSSSDLSRVTVTRTDPQTKETKKMTFDLNAVALPDMSYSGSPPPIPWAHDLWLRDGDVIEVPEKP